MRDYVHVADVARAHVTAARALAEGRALAPVYNLGSGAGTSVRQIMEAVGRVTGRDVDPDVEPAYATSWRTPHGTRRVVAADGPVGRRHDEPHHRKR